MTNATNAQIETANALIENIDRTLEVVIPVVTHIAFTVGTGLVIALKLVLTAILIAVTFILEKLEENKVTNNESLNEASAKIQTVTNDFIADVKKEVPGLVRSSRKFLVLQFVKLRDAAFDSESEEAINA